MIITALCYNKVCDVKEGYKGEFDCKVLSGYDYENDQMLML